jgi:hypothetical protein
MRKLLLITLVSSLIFTNVSFAQDGNQDVGTLEDNHLPSVYFGVGLLDFKGNIGTLTNMSIYSDSKLGYSAGIDERLWNTGLAIGVNYLGGKLAKSQRYISQNANFQSSIWSIGVNLTYNFDNGYILSRLSRIAPYFTVGVDYLSFNSFADLKDASGNQYNYWNDGTIRSLPQNSTNAETAYLLSQDYSYETDLHALASSQGNSYSQNTISIPLGLGIAFKLTPAFSIDVKGTYYMTQTKWIDDLSNQNGGNLTGNAKNDAYLYTSISLRYNLGVSINSSYDDPRYRDVDFKALANEDSDGDGVRDLDDRCPGTPKGVKVDKHGCPVKQYEIAENKVLDKDNANYVDSATTYIQVPANFVEPDYTNYHPVKRENKYDISSNNTKDVAKPINKPSINSEIPEELKIADFDHDGIITIKEINAVIDAFFDGDKRFSVPFINKLVDYFFDQQ